MTKKQVKAIFKRLKYYHPTLLMNEKETRGIKEGDEKAVRRLEKESIVVAKLMAMVIYDRLPTDYSDIRTQITKKEAKRLLHSDQTKSDGIFSRGGISMIYMTEEEFEEYYSAYKDLVV